MVGQPFLQNAGAIYRLAVEIAWGADLTDLTGAGWSWTDVTTDVQVDQGAGISITVGRQDESSTTQTSNMTCILDNRTGAYSEGGQSSNYPNVRRNTPIRVRVSVDSGSNWTVKYQGNIVGFSPNWDTTGRWATVTITAAGPLRRLDQGTLPSNSSIFTYMISGADATITNYWPMEDPATSTAFRQALGSLGPGHVIGGVNNRAATPPPSALFKLASDSAFSASAPIAVAGSQSDGSTTATVNSWASYAFPYPPAGTQQISGVFNPSGSTKTLIFVLFANGGLPGTPYVQNLAATFSSWVGVHYEPDAPGMASPQGGTLNLAVLDGGASVTLRLAINGSSSTAMKNLAGIPFRWRFANSGTTWTLGILRAGDVAETTLTGTAATLNLATYTDAQVSPFYNGSPSKYPGGGGGVGHIAYHNAPSSLTGSAAAVNAHSGESPSTRVSRLGVENIIPVTVVDSAIATNSSIADVVGPQYYDTLSNLLRECEVTNQGALYDGLGIGLTYITRKYKESQQAAFTLDASAGQVVMPFAPVDDDRLNVNQVKVSLHNGPSASYEDDTGPLGVNAIGVYGTSLTVNPSDPTSLDAYAKWLVGLGTQQGYRYPTWTFYLHKPSTKALIPSWLATVPSSRFDVTNISTPRTQHLNDTIRNLLEGWTETITQFEWIVTANATNYDPWKVITVAAATGSTADTVCHADTDSSQLNASATAGATSLSVKTNSGPVWITAAGTGGSDNFPFDIDVGGVKVHVTNITATISPQTFTVSAIPQNFANATPVKVWRPPVLGL